MAKKRNEAPQPPATPPTISLADGKRFLEHMREEGRTLVSNRRVSDDAADIWQNTTLDYIKQTFGSDNPYKHTFRGQPQVRISGGFGNDEEPDYETANAHEIERQTKVLDDLIKLIDKQASVLAPTILPQTSGPEPSIGQMDAAKAKQLLNRQIEESKTIPKDVNAASPIFQKWARDTEIAIEKIFSDSTRHLDDFNAIHFTAGHYYTGQPSDAHEVACQNGLERARAILSSMIDEIDKYGLRASEGIKPEKKDIVGSVVELCSRFPLVVRQLRHRHANRPTLEVKDEYDVQDLLHGILHLYFDDIRPEEWTPSYAGGSARMDFLLKREQTVIEVKKTREGLAAREVGDQLLIDIQRYQSHQNCKTLVCLVYDPEHRIANPRGLEDDLSCDKSGIRVQVVIAPK